MNWDEIKASKTPVPVTEEHYWYALEVLPPIYGRGCFAMGEAADHTPTGETVYYCFRAKGNQFTAFYGTLPEAEAAFAEARRA